MTDLPVVSFPGTLSVRDAPAHLGLTEFQVENVAELLRTHRFAPGDLGLLFRILPFHVSDHPEVVHLALLQPGSTRDDWVTLLGRAPRRRVYSSLSAEQKAALPEGAHRVAYLREILPDSAWENARSYLDMAYDMDDAILEVFTALVSDASFDLSSDGIDALFQTLRQAALVLAV